ncbi:MAG: hypothetical protein KAK00_10025 [Nanoarchaeota archaeon]|nr:hypothetical protein [Nanoarchaeota archaeon]
MKYFLIYNPASRQGKSKKDFDKIITILKNKGINFDYSITNQKDEAISLAKQASKDYEVIVAVGGDGTICEVITGIMSRKKPLPKLGVIHIGTSPDFNRFHNIPVKLEQAVDTLLKGKTKKIDIGKISHLDLNKKNTISYFGSSVNVGLGPDIASKSNGRYREYLGDFLGTLFSTLVSLTQYKKSDFKLKVNNKDMFLKNVINITIGKDPYLASGMRIPLEIKSDNGKMYILSITAKSRISLLLNLWRLYFGNILDSSDAKLKYCKNVKLDDNKINPKIEFDGDFRGYLPATIEILPSALGVVVHET